MQDVPFWATVWPAAQLLAAYFLDRPETVGSKAVLDVGCGGGVAGIAALRAGAKSVVANDIDPVALMVAARNAAANGFRLGTDGNDLLRRPPSPDWEIILVGDMFYDRTVSELMLEWLAVARRQGSAVFIADSQRPFSPQKDVAVLREEKYATDEDLEGRSERTVRLLAFQP
jgi:predicted nicotinamide N-methyase